VISKRRLARAGLAAMVALHGVQHAHAELQALTAEQLLGKALYHFGVAGADRALHGTVAGVALPPAALACANCHGVDGGGGRESRIAAPALQPFAQSSGSHDTTVLRRALVSPRPGSGMAHYSLDDPTLAALESYLRVLGTLRDVDPGISDTAVVLGALLPMSGPLSGVGADAAAALRRAFEQVNTQRGVYGRRIELEVHDTQASVAATLHEIDTIVDEGRVFALVGSVIPDEDDVVDALARVRLPLIGVLTPPGSAAARASRHMHFLLPGLFDQARALVDHISSESGERARVAVLALDGPIYDDGIDGALKQAALHPGLRLEKLRVRDAAQLSVALRSASFDYLLYFCAPADTPAVMQALIDSGSNATALTSIMTAGGVAALPRAATPPRLLLAYPATLRRAEADLSGGQRNEAIRALADLSARVTIEILKDIGRSLTRAGLSIRLNDLRMGSNRDLPASLRQLGSQAELAGVYVLTVDSKTKSAKLASGHIVPHD
jgi:mono/diheme cytochrome c family protein